MSKTTPIRILALDGGGVRGLSEVLILKNLFQRIDFDENAGQRSARLLEPWKYFDLICGTSTGGLLALMLGRLRMACEEAYLCLSKEIFNEPKSGPYLYDADILQKKIEELLTKISEPKDTPLLDGCHDSCHTFVIAVRHQFVDAPAVLLKSYSVDGTEIRCSIIQAARATTAAPTFFAPAPIGLDMYIDGGVGYNNPAELAILEAHRIWPSRPIGCLVSLGTGRSIPISGESRTTQQLGLVFGTVMRTVASRAAEKLTVAEYCTKLATSCQAVHLHLLEHNLLAKGRFRERYYRFDVEYGALDVELNEWEKESLISARTNAYLDDPSEKRKLRDCAILLRSVEELRTNQEVKSKHLPIFNIPYRRNPLFTGHADTLKMIHKKLVLQAQPGFTSSYVIYGLGGVGKTQLAIEYSYQHHNDFDIIYWLRADDYETLLRSNYQLYEDPLFRGLTGLNLGDENNLEKISAQVKSWFERCQDFRWLLVIDNADKLQRDSVSPEHQIETIGSIIPKGQSGCVLVTSRDRSALGQLATDGEELLVMDEDEAKNFLFKCSKADPTKSEDVAALVNELGRLPLAIEQAAGFIRETGVTIHEYRRLYNANRSDALREGLSLTHRREYYHETVNTTWNVSFNAIHERDHLASIILQIAAFLDGKQIQKELFYNAKLRINEKEEILSEWKVNKAFGMLMSYSLVRPIKDQGGIEMHLLVQNVIRDDDKTDKIQCFMWSAELVRKQFPWGGDSSNLKSCRKYVSQAQNCVAMAESLQFGTSDIEKMLESIAGYFWLAGQFQQSLSSNQKALKILETQYGVGHINSADTIMRMGVVYDSQGKYAEAMSWYERALKIREREFGVDHISSANTINNIGEVYCQQGKYADALSWYERALKIKEREFGVDHINSAGTITNSYSEGKYAEAISCYEQALNIFEREFGVDHINSAETINNIGEVYCQQGMYADAMSWYDRALKIFEREYGEDHINSAHTTNNIGEVYCKQGKYGEAISWSERALKIFEREFGVDHVNSASTLYILGLVYENREDWMSAKSYFERAAQLHRQCRGVGHEFTVVSERKLANAIKALNNNSHGTPKPKRRKLSHTKRLC